MRYVVNVNDEFNGGDMNISREFEARQDAVAYARLMVAEGYGEGIEMWDTRYETGDKFIPQHLWLPS
jgi:hypothetical protein